MRAVSRIHVRDFASFIKLGMKAQEVTAWSRADMTEAFRIMSILDETTYEESFDANERALVITKLAEYYNQYRKTPELLSNMNYEPRE